MRLTLCIGLWLLLGLAQAQVEVVDDTGRVVRLDTPARRIVALAPHLTELLFAAGAGDALVGVSDYSNYPPRAQGLPSLGSYQRIDLEALLAAAPDLVVVWGEGNGAAQIDHLRDLGLPVYVNQPHDLAGIAQTLRRLGRLTGTETLADAQADAFLARLRALESRYATRPPLRLFYQIWDNPLMSIGNDALVAQVFPLCGAINIFADLGGGAPMVSREAVLVADPEVILASGMAEERPEWLDAWRDWPELNAVSHHRLLFIHPDLLQRPTPRLLDGAEQLCRSLEGYRQEAVP